MLVTFGFGRFAYGVQLPAMRDELGWSYTASGGLATANLLAYLAGSQLARVLLLRLPPRRLLVYATAGTALALSGMAAATSLLIALVSMVALGMLSALAWLSVVQLVTSDIPVEKQGRFLGVASLGAAWGIPFVGGLVGLVRVIGGATAWRWGWVAMVVIAAGAAITASAALRRGPTVAIAASSPGPWRDDMRVADVRRVLTAYVLYGAWFAIFSTFVVSFLEDGGASKGSATLVWSLLGLAAGFGTLVAGRAADRFGTRPVLVSFLSATAGTAVLLGLSPASSRLVLTIAVGFPLVGTGTVLTMLASRLLADAHAATRLVAIATTANGLGQAIGPVLAGPIIDATDSYTYVFAVAAACGAGAAMLVRAVKVTEPARLIAPLAPELAPSSAPPSAPASDLLR
jgi:predicted MFS family arabinose efflux permease